MRASILLLLCLTALSQTPSSLIADELAIDLQNAEASKDWIFLTSPFVYVCKDAGAGGYEAFPDVCRLSDGRLMCAFYAGYGHVALPNDQLPNGGRIAYCMSSDEGQTWSAAATR